MPRKTKKNKKRKKLLVIVYPSGIVGRGKKVTKFVTSTLTPSQYVKRFYHSDYHLRTEYAMEAYRLSG